MEGELSDQEVRLIAEHDTYRNGLNCTPGGESSPMLNPEVVAKVRATWDRKLEAELEGADKEEVLRRKGNLARRRERKEELKAGIVRNGRQAPHPRCSETWNRKREKQAEETEARRLAAEDKRLEGMDPKRAAAIRKYSKHAKQYRLAKYAARTGNFLANS